MKNLEFLTEKHLARRWNISSRTLQRWRWSDEGLPYMKIGGRVRYSIENIKKFEEENTHYPAAKNNFVTVSAILSKR